MAFLCPVRIKRSKKKKPLHDDSVSGAAPSMGRITGSASIETLVRVGIEKENGLGPESKMVVLHDFTPCVDDELEVKRGQIVHVLYQENDWVYVISEENREGFIPHSYCAQYGSQMAALALNVKKKMPRGPAAETVAAKNPDQALTNNNNNQVTAMNTSATDQSRTNSMMSDSTSTGDSSPFLKESAGRYVVLYSYTAQDENDLSVERGQCVTVLNADDPDWYWVSRYDQCEGFVPSGFIYPLDAIQRQQNLAQGLGSPGGNSQAQSVSQQQQSLGVRALPQNNPLQGGPPVQQQGPLKGQPQQQQPPFGQYQPPPPPPQQQLPPQQPSQQAGPAQQQTHHAKPVTLAQPQQAPGNSLTMPGMVQSQQAPPPQQQMQNQMKVFPPQQQAQQGLAPAPPQAYHSTQPGAPAPAGSNMNPAPYNQLNHNFPSTGPYNHNNNNNPGSSLPTNSNLVRQPAPLSSGGSSGLHPPLGSSGGSSGPSSYSTTGGMSSLQGGNTSGLPPAPGEPQQPAQTDNNSTRYNGTELVMLYDYKAQAPDDLTVRRGDWVYADLSNQTVDGWLWCYSPKARKYGFIPKAYARPPAMTSL